LTEEEPMKDPRYFLRNDPNGLRLFLKNLRKFNELFCKFVFNRSEFTIKLEVRGVKGGVIHCRVYSDDLEKPSK